MAKIEPRNFHRLAVAVRDVPEAADFMVRMFGALPIGGSESLMQNSPGRDVGNLAGTDTRMLWVGGYPMILLSGGTVTRFLERHGPGVQSWAWEVDDNWSVEHIVRDQGIEVVSVMIMGRFFFMHPKQTHGLLMEWCDGKIPRNPEADKPGNGLVPTTGMAWTSGVVADADAFAEWMSGFVEVEEVTTNPKGPAELERTIDLAAGDITIRLITPLSPESRYHAALQEGPRVHSFAMRVPDLDAALGKLEAEGIPTIHRDGGLAATDPASTLGIKIEWTV